MKTWQAICGDDGECVVIVVDGADVDGVAVHADDAVDDAGVVDGAGRSQRVVGWVRLWVRESSTSAGTRRPMPR